MKKPSRHIGNSTWIAYKGRIKNCEGIDNEVETDPWIEQSVLAVV